jgi:hypothetical protein
MRLEGQLSLTLGYHPYEGEKLICLILIEGSSMCDFRELEVPKGLEGIPRLVIIINNGLGYLALGTVEH